MRTRFKLGGNLVFPMIFAVFVSFPQALNEYLYVYYL